MDIIDKLNKLLLSHEKDAQNAIDVDEIYSDSKESEEQTEESDISEPAPESAPKEDEDLIRESTYQDMPTATAYGISLRGRSHITDSKPCQDYHKMVALSDGWAIATVSDGAGSAAESARGSKANCELACEMFKLLISKGRWIENSYLPSEVEWHREAYNIFSLIQDVIKQKAREESVEAKLFNATLMVVIVTPKGLLSAHIGDGRMGYRTQDGTWQMMMIPHKGDEANQTVFIPNEWNKKIIPAFRMSGVYLPESYVIERSDIDAFVMLSDGCEQAMWQCYAWDESVRRYIDRNHPQEAFLNPLIKDISSCKAEDEAIQRLAYIVREGTTACQREKDDQTLLVVTIK